MIATIRTVNIDGHECNFSPLQFIEMAVLQYEANEESIVNPINGLSCAIHYITKYCEAIMIIPNI